MSQEEFDRRVVESYNALPGEISSSYGWGGRPITGRPNSNNAATSILAGAGVNQGRINQYQQQLSVTTGKATPGLGHSWSGSGPNFNTSNGIFAQISAILSQISSILSGK